MALCRELGIYLIHDLAYADLVFDGYRAPSVLEVAGGEGCCGGVLYAVEELQHAGVARGVYGGKYEAGCGFGAASRATSTMGRLRRSRWRRLRRWKGRRIA